MEKKNIKWKLELFSIQKMILIFIATVLLDRFRFRSLISYVFFHARSSSSLI